MDSQECHSQNRYANNSSSEPGHILRTQLWLWTWLQEDCSKHGLFFLGALAVTILFRIHPPPKKNSVLLLNRERALTYVWYGEVHSARLWRLPDQCYTSYLKSPKEKSLHAGFCLPYSFVSSQVCIRAECHSFLFYIQLLANYSHSFFLHLCPLDQSLVDLERWVISCIYIYQFIDLILISHLLGIWVLFFGVCIWWHHH